MTRRSLWLKCIFIALLVGAVALAVFRRGVSHRNAAPSHQSENASGPRQPHPSSTDASAVEADRQRALVEQGFEAIFEGMKKAGAKEIPPVAERLQEAVESGDRGMIARAFHEAIYDRFAKMDEAIPAIKGFLDHSDPFVRFKAAEKLYTVGNQSGSSTLIDIINATQPFEIDGNDGSIRSANLLGKYRDRHASSAISYLYQKTKDRSVLNALVRIERENTPAEVIPDLLHAKQPAFALYNASLTGSPETSALAIEIFQNPKVPTVYEQETKNIAAWAAIRSGAREPYLNHLMQQAEKAIRNEVPQNGNVDVNQFKTAFKYLASIPETSVQDLLERALDSPNNEIVQIAVVNLLFNQPNGSDKAKQVVLRELRGEQRMLGAELMLNIAVKLDDPEIRSAGEMFDQRTGENAWKRYSVERRQWPVYNWIGDYVVDSK